MKFSNFLEAESSIDDVSVKPDQEYFTKEDILEMIGVLSEDELQEIGEELLELLFDEEEDYDSDDIDEDTLDEKKYFNKKAHQVKKEKKVDKSAKRKLAKKRKQMYKKNKSKIKRDQKKYRKKTKRRPSMVRSHR